MYQVIFFPAKYPVNFEQRTGIEVVSERDLEDSTRWVTLDGKGIRAGLAHNIPTIFPGR
jgi:hypothetical protein